MKSKDCEKKTIEYRHRLWGIHLGVDDTDHISFFCPKCNKPMEIIEVVSKKMQIDMEGTKDYCTWIYLVCNKCKELGQRKFYWNNKLHDYRGAFYCGQRTDNIPRDEHIRIMIEMCEREEKK